MTSNLRPYYNPATFNSPIKGGESIGFVTGTSNSDTSYGSSGMHRSKSAGGSGFDYLDVDFGGTGDSITGIGISLTRLYSKVFVSQPWEVSRLLLQVGQWDDELAKYGKKSIRRTRTTVDQTTANETSEDEEDEDEEINYFTAVTGDYNLSKEWSAARDEQTTGSGEEEEEDDDVIVEHNHVTPPTPGSIKKRKQRDNSKYLETIQVATTNLVDILSALNEKDGFKGLWRGINTSFIIDALGSTIEAWLSGFFSSISGIPDPHFVEVLHSPNPIVSLGAALCATVLTSVIISPIDMIRTRLAVTTFGTQYPRSIRTSLWETENYLSPTSVLIPTVLYSGIPGFINKATPYFLYIKLGIDKFNSPSLYSLLTLCSSLFELAIKLPLETIVRRAHLDSLQLDPESLIVKPIEYHGVLSTFWNVMLGYDRPDTLFRGWRVSVVGAIGEWGVNAIQSSERAKERF